MVLAMLALPVYAAGNATAGNMTPSAMSNQTAMQNMTMTQNQTATQNMTGQFIVP
jgi:hypothetical protein